MFELIDKCMINTIICPNGKTEPKNNHFRVRFSLILRNLNCKIQDIMINIVKNNETIVNAITFSFSQFYFSSIVCMCAFFLFFHSSHYVTNTCEKTNQQKGMKNASITNGNTQTKEAAMET